MTMLRVEWLRLVRTRRWIAVFAPFLLFGLASPLLVRYQQQLVERFATGVQITFPKPTVLAALQQHEANAAQLGALAVIIVAAMALAIDADPQRSIFLRTRARSLASVVAVRAGVVAAAAVAAWLLGSLGAWYETVVLIGAPDVPGALAGIGFGALAQLVSVALVVAAIGIVRGTTAAAAIALITYFTLPLLDLVSALERWSPVRLQEAFSQLGSYPAGVVIVCLVKPTGVLSDSFCEAVPKALQRVRQIPGRMVGLVVPPTLGGEARGWNVSDDGDAMKSDAILGFAQKEFEGHSLCGTSPIPMGDGWGEKELVGVLVTHVETIWAAGKRVFPDLLNQLDALGPVLGTSREQQILGDLYRSRPFETISDRFFPFLHSQMEVHAIAANIL